MREPARFVSLGASWRTSSRASWGETTSWIALSLCIGVAIGLRFYAIDRLPGINGDEPQYAVHAHELFTGAPLSSLRTGSDLPMNPVFFGTVVVLQALLPPTLWTLRLTAVLLSLATITLAWLLFRQRGATFVATFACLVAALPIHLGYARFAWDPSAVPVAAVLALGASMRKRAGWCLAAFVLALWVHPTAVFLAPCLIAPFLTRFWPRDSFGRWRWSRKQVLQASAVLLLLPLTAAVFYVGLERDWLPVAVAHKLRGDLPAHALQRAQDPAQLGRFLLAYLELLSGPTIYKYIIGPLPERITDRHVFLALLLMLPLLVAGLRAAAARQRGSDVALALGLMLSLLFLYLLAGPDALRPTTERYAIALTVPACCVLSACVDALASSTTRASLLRVAVSVVSGALLLSFSTNYLQGLRFAEPTREDAFRTGEVEPKEQALRVISQLRDPQKTAVIYTEDWWSYWPIRYLATPLRNTRVTIYKAGWDYRFPRDYDPPIYDPTTMELFGVAWAGHGLDSELARFASERREIFGYEKGPILRVYKLHQLPKPKRKKPRRAGH